MDSAKAGFVQMERDSSHVTSPSESMKHEVDATVSLGEGPDSDKSEAERADLVRRADTLVLIGVLMPFV